jgi:hypothetical protein
VALVALLPLLLALLPLLLALLLLLLGVVLMVGTVALLLVAAASCCQVAWGQPDWTACPLPQLDLLLLLPRVQHLCLCAAAAAAAAGLCCRLTMVLHPPLLPLD